MHDLLRQRIFQTACGYADGNDSNELRNDPLFKIATGRAPLSTGNELASGSTFSRLEASMTRKDIYRLAKSFVQAFIASYSKQPEIIVPGHGSLRRHHTWLATAVSFQHLL